MVIILLNIAVLNISEITKKDYKKQLVKDITVFLKKKKKKSHKMSVKDVKSSLKMKSKGKLGMEKNLRKNNSL